MFDDLWTVRQLGEPVPLPLQPGPRPRGAPRLRGGGMNRSTREVSQGADVIHVEMRDDDVPHVVLGEPEPSGLPCRGLLRAEHGPDDVPEPPEAARQAGDVLQPEAGVDQNQAGVGFEQEDMGHQRRDSGHAHGSAVEVMGFHRDSSP